MIDRRHAIVLILASGVVVSTASAGTGSASSGEQPRPLSPSDASLVRHADAKPPDLPDSSWYLKGLDMRSDTDGWAVGGRQVSFNSRPWVGHWDGQRWHRTLTPHRYLGDLSDVVALASNDVWAVGRYYPGKVGPLILHWDGTAWRRVAHSPSDGALNSVSATGPNDVWASGIMDQSGLIMHWDGTHWHASEPPAARDQYVVQVAAVAPDDVWGITNEAALHWNGSTWRKVALPGLGQHAVLTDLTMHGRRDGWIVGATGYSQDSVPVALHWDGDQWSQVDVPSPQGTYVILNAVSSLGRDSAWAVGDRAASDGGLFVERWNGSEWQLAEAPPSQPGDDRLTDIDVLADDDVWTVGEFIDGSPTGFVAHWDGDVWSVDS